MKILIVDDNKEWRESLIRFIRRGLEEHISKLWFFEASTMAEAMEHLHSGALVADITLLDLSLPDSTKEETLARIMEFPPPVIVTSADDDIILRAAAFAAGARGYFGKDNIIRLCARIADVRLQDLQEQGLIPILEQEHPMI